MSMQGGNDPSGEPPNKPIDPNSKIKNEEPSEAEKIYYMCALADNMKNVHPTLFPHNGKQVLKNLKLMFAVPRGVVPQGKNTVLFRSLITDLRYGELRSQISYGPSPVLERMFMKNCDLARVGEMKGLHSGYAMMNCLLLKVVNVPCLALETAHLLNYSFPGDEKRYLWNCRTRWYAMNLIRFPSSPQITAAQILRNHSRLYSEVARCTADSGVYHKAVKNLMLYCTGLERALFPENGMDMSGHMKMSWHRIRKRVLERMMEEANKVMNTDRQTSFLHAMPFNIRSIQEFVTEVEFQLEQCDILWEKENEGEIMLSDGPDMEEDEDMDGQEEKDIQYERETGGRGDMGREKTVQRTVNQSMQHVQPVRWAPPAHSLPAASNRMNQLHSFHQEQRKTQQNTGGERGDIGGTLAARLAHEMMMGGATTSRSTPMQKNVTGTGGVPIPQMTPSRGGDRGQGPRVLIRRDQHNQHLVDRNPSASPSTSATHIRPTPTLTKTPTSAAPTTTTPQQQQQMQPPRVQQTPRPLPQTGQTLPGVQHKEGVADRDTAQSVGHSPFLSSPHLYVMGENGMMQPIPSVVYVQQTDHGLVEVTPPTPQPQFVMTIPSMTATGGARSHSGSVKRRLSRERQIVKRRMIYGDSGDGSSEDSADDEKRKERGKERRKEEDRKQKEEEERREKEQREMKEKEDKEEEEMRMKDEEEAEEMKRKENERIELEKVRKEEELKGAEMERIRLAEEKRKEKEREREEDMANKKTVEEERDTVVRVLAEESEENGEDEGVVSEEEVVPESVFTQSDHEEGEKEMDPSTVTTTDTVDRGRETGDDACAVKSSVVNGVNTAPVPSRDDGEDSEIEVVFDGPGEERHMSTGYCEIVKEVCEVKRELDDKTSNEVIYLKQTKSTDGSRHSRGSRKNRGSLDGSINEKKEEVKEEETDTSIAIGMPPLVVPPVTGMESSRSETTVKTEVEEETSSVTRRAGVATSTTTAMTEVKSEVKEEEMEEDEDMDTMSETGNADNGQMMEDTMNASAILNLATERREAEVGRMSVLEAITQDNSTQVSSPSPFPLPTDVSTTVPPTESLPMETLSQSAVAVSSPSTTVTTSVEMTRETQSQSDRPVSTVATISTVSPRPTPIRASSHVEKTVTQSPIPPLKTRPSAKYVDILEKSDMLIRPYQQRMEEIEGRVEKEKEKDKKREKKKEKEVIEVEVVKEVPMDEADSHMLRFHAMRGEAATLSEDRRRAIRDESIDSHSKAVVFTNRPLYKGEKVTLKVIEISPEWKGKIRLGLTTKNPLEYSSREAIPKQLMNERVEDEGEMHHLTYLYDSGTRGTVKMDTELVVQLTEKGDQMKYSLDGVDMGVLGGGLQVARPMWMSVDIYGFVKGMEIVESVLPTQDLVEAAKDDQNTCRFKMEMDQSMGEGAVKEEVKQEDTLPTTDDTLVRQQSLTLHTAVVHEMERGDISPLSTDIIPLSTVTVVSSEDTVENAEGDGREETAVEVEGDGVTTEEREETIEYTEEKRVEEEDGEIAMSRVEKRTIEEEVGELEEDGEEGEGGDQPPKKKMRIHIEQPTEVIVEEEKEREEETEEEEGKDQEMESEKSQANVVIGIEKETVEVQMDRVEVTEDEVIEMREETEEGKEKEAVVEEIEENQLMEDTVEKEEEGVDSDGNGGIMDGEEKEVACENATVMEGWEMDESNDIMDLPVEKSGLSDQKEKEDKETIIAVESTVEESMEVEEMPVHPLRRRSLFGPGCLSFDHTLDGKEKNEEEKEGTMEVDEQLKNEMSDSVPIRRLSLFGPGSASFNLIVNKMRDQ